MLSLDGAKGRWQIVPDMEQSSNRPKGTSSLERGIRILQALATRSETSTPARELLKRSRIPRTSFYRAMKSLMEAGLVAQDPWSGDYRLGMGMLNLGFFARRASPIVRAGEPILKEVASNTHQMCELTVPIARWDFVMLDVWQVEDTPVAVRARYGLIHAINHQIAHGLCYLSFGDGRRLSEYLKLAATKEGRRTLRLKRGAPAGLKGICDRSRRRGFVWSKNSAGPGKGRVVVPFYDPRQDGRLAGTLGIVCESRLLNSSSAARWGSILMKQAKELEKAL